MPGFWKRPIGRVYSYNLDLGENYYAPMKDYIGVADRRARGDSPGPLTHSERLARRWIQGDKDREYRSQRARTEARQMASENESQWRRAASSARTTASRFLEDEEQEDSEAVRRADSVLNAHRDKLFTSADRAYSRVFENSHRSEDDIYKKMADIRMSPWRGQELEQELRMAQESRARLTSLERELENITKSAMRYRPVYHKSARELAREALNEDLASSSCSTHKKITSRIYSESSRRVF